MFNYKLIALAFFTVIQLLTAQAYNNSKILNGYWEGKYPMGPDFKIVLCFNIENNLKDQSFLRIYKGNSKFGDEQIKSFDFEGNNLSFKVHVVNADFKGTVIKNKITAKLSFPNGQEAKFECEKVKSPFYESKKESAAKKEINILTHKYSVEELHEDFKFLLDSIKHYQPNLFTFTSQKEFGAIINKAALKLNEEKTELEFLRILTTVTEKVGCGHLGVGPSQKAMMLQRDAKLLPFLIKFINGRFYISENFVENAGDMRGSEIVSINSRRIEDIINEMLDGISSDGRNLSSKYCLIENYFPSLYVTHIEVTNDYELEYRAAGSKDSQKLKFTGMPFNQLMQAYVSNHPEKAPGSFPIAVKRIDDKTEYLKITQFFFRDKDQYDNFLDSIFADYKERAVENLIIDVRGNQGGRPPFSFQLLSYLANENFQYFKSPQKLKRSYNDLFELKEISPNAFGGDIYILMDGGCKSSTGHFLALAKYHNWAGLIGRETGSTFYCNDGSIKLQLPNTKINLNQPREEVITAVEGFDKLKPLQPDYKVDFNFEDLVSKRDPDLAFALELIKKN